MSQRSDWWLSLMAGFTVGLAAVVLGILKEWW